MSERAGEMTTEEMVENICDLAGFQGISYRDQQTGELVRKFRREDINRVLDALLALKQGTT